jgi:beta-galactosidase
VLSPDRTRLDGAEDLVFVTVRIEDAAGALCPLADNQVRFTVSGPGRLAAVDNGNPASLEPFQSDQRRAFGGLALAVVRGQRGTSGAIQVTAVSEGLHGGSVSLTLAPR